ncbi:hypothetical protein ACQJBY_040805 [Aegilops geniculata]
MGDVRVVSRRVVRPEPTASPSAKAVHLTPWDLRSIAVEYIQKGILLPKPPATGGQGRHDVDVERLASSFARALGRFYPYAGRLAVAPAREGRASPESLAISLRCSGEGAEFVHAVAPGVAVADITASLLIPRVVWSFFPLNGLLGADAIADSRPVLAAQITELADGVFIAMSMNHSVADGTTFWQFFNTWSELTRLGLSAGDAAAGQRCYGVHAVARVRQVVPRRLHHPHPSTLRQAGGHRRPACRSVPAGAGMLPPFFGGDLEEAQGKGERRDLQHHHHLLAAGPARAPVARRVTRPAARAGPGDGVHRLRRMPGPRWRHTSMLRGQRAGARHREILRRRDPGQRPGLGGMAAEPGRGVV